MRPDPDELAGVADLFGGLTREELRVAFSDLAARSGAEFDPDELDAAVDEALDGYYLVAVQGERQPEGGGGDGTGGGDDDGGGDASESGDDRGEDAFEDRDDRGGNESGGRELLAGGPTALPRLPEGGEDLPHLLDVGNRSIDREALGEGALVRLRGDAARAVNDGDEERIATLLDVCYDLEAWAPVETGDLRAQLDEALGDQ